MVLPTTPKKGDDGINNIVRSLSAKWGLQLLPRVQPWSPNSRPISLEEQVFTRIQYLYYRHQEALQYALELFDEYAVAAFSQWKFKPGADLDVLPSRVSSESALRRDAFLKRREGNEDTTSDLTECLLRFLTEVADRVKLGVDYRAPDHLQDREGILQPEEPIDRKIPNLVAGRSPRPGSVRAPQRQSSLNRYFTPMKDGSPFRKPPSKDKGIPSDEFYPDLDTSALLRDITMTDMPAGLPMDASSRAGNIDPPPVGFQRSGPMDEDFQTPPTTPPPPSPRAVGPNIVLVQARGYLNRTGDAFFNQNKDVIPLPELKGSGRKRSYPEPTKSPTPRKTSRETPASKPRPMLNVNSLFPAAILDTRGAMNYCASVEIPIDSKRLSLKPELSRSFSGSNSPLMTPISTAWTTPNTSFHTDSATTSFSSSTDMPDIAASFATNHKTSLCSDKAIGGRGNSTNSRRSMGPPNTVIGGSLDEYLSQHLMSNSPFDSLINPESRALPFRQLYEVTRISKFCDLSDTDMSSCLGQSIDDYENTWSSLRSIAKAHSKVMPDKSSTAAYIKAGQTFEGVALTGTLKFREQRGGPVFSFQLEPLKIEASYRLSRRFGSDRFCTIIMPGISSEDLPAYLNSDPTAARKNISKWLINTTHSFLGRSWRAFYVTPYKAVKKVKKGYQSSFNEPVYRVFLFAEDGYDFKRNGQTGEIDPRKTDHSPMTVKNLINWFMPATENQNQMSLKFFSRLALGVSKTIPAVEFNPGEIIRSDDARADCPDVRRLRLQRSDEKKARLKPSLSQAPVMNDGCARISKAAALGIAQKLNLDQVPCVYQGRFGGAKGIWMVDVSGETLPQIGREYWIEVTDSQLKFEGPASEGVFPDPARLTFEVHSWSRSLSPASLNYQLIPILLDRGVPSKVFMTLLEEDLTAKVGNLEAAMDSGLALRKWNQDNNPVSEERTRNKGIEMLGGRPDSLSEKVNWFIEHGFEPRTCRFLRDLLYKSIKNYCMRLEERMNIGLGRSTYAFMIADPLAILEENEVHIGFSNLFRDAKSGWAETMIHDEDVLVARSPALLPSDIQKVHAVFKPQLRVYRDVIIFSSKGGCSLAEKLSGGDYDGDKAWICWEPSIVIPFTNTPVPDFPSLDLFNIVKDTTKVSEFFTSPTYPTNFLHHSFDFNLQSNMLGPCTSYHESLCYAHRSIDRPAAMNIAVLLGYLVDRPKAGLVFDDAKWIAFLKKSGLKIRLPKPAYKNRDKAQPTSHMIDVLVFQVAKDVRQKALGQFSRHFGDAGTWDEALLTAYNYEAEEAAKGDAPLSQVLTDLKSKLKAIVKFWQCNVRVDGDDEEGRPLRKPNALSFKAVVEQCRTDFLSLQPLQTPTTQSHPLIQRWIRECTSPTPTTVGATSWPLLKASAFFSDHHRTSLVWYACGTELGEMKAVATGRGTYRAVVGGIFGAMKIDGKVVDRARREAEEGGEGVAGEGEDEEDEFGDLEWGSQWG